MATLSILTATGCGAPGLPGEACGGDTTVSCSGSSFCFYERGCGDAGEPGVCQPIPEICIELFQPVCGCDGKTYSNQCMARASGVNVASEGQCEKTP